jgi:hypothetical protein
MPDQPRYWRKTYERIKGASTAHEKHRLCQQARRLMQRRLVQLGAGSPDPKEQAALETALRDLWVMEQQIGAPGRHSRKES